MCRRAGKLRRRPGADKENQGLGARGLETKSAQSGGESISPDETTSVRPPEVRGVGPHRHAEVEGPSRAVDIRDVAGDHLLEKTPKRTVYPCAGVREQGSHADELNEQLGVLSIEPQVIRPCLGQLLAGRPPATTTTPAPTRKHDIITDLLRNG